MPKGSGWTFAFLIATTTTGPCGVANERFSLLPRPDRGTNGIQVTESSSASFSRGAPSSASRLPGFGVGMAVWSLVTLASATQGQLFAAYHGRHQDWWDTLGYTAAIFSVWALLTPAVLFMADRIYAARPPRMAAATILALGYPVTTALHIALFVLLFWPVYGTNLPTHVAMAKLVFLANLDKSVFAYAALIAFVHVRRHIRQRAEIANRATTKRTDEDGLWIRVAGSSHLVRFHEIDWIAAAGDYAEVHAGKRSLLTDSSLAALAGQLPENEFARIHRSAIIRLDRVREVRRVGRGDASIFLNTGQALRLSRRYRENLATHLPL